jgi:hypothetical protein
MTKIVVRLAIATMGTGVIVAWALLDLDASVLALGGGLVIGNLLAWVAASFRTPSTEMLLRWVMWALFAGLAVSFIALQNAFLTFLFFGGLVSLQIHYFFDRYSDVIGARRDHR